MIALKSVLQEIVNCWLGYVLSQPVEIDIVILVYFLANYVGITQLQNVVEKLRNAQRVSQCEPVAATADGGALALEPQLTFQH